MVCPKTPDPRHQEIQSPSPERKVHPNGDNHKMQAQGADTSSTHDGFNLFRFLSRVAKQRHIVASSDKANNSEQTPVRLPTNSATAGASSSRVDACARCSDQEGCASPPPSSRMEPVVAVKETTSLMDPFGLFPALPIPLPPADAETEKSAALLCLNDLLAFGEGRTSECVGLPATVTADGPGTVTALPQGDVQPNDAPVPPQGDVQPNDAMSMNLTTTDPPLSVDDTLNDEPVFGHEFVANEFCKGLAQLHLVNQTDAASSEESSSFVLHVMEALKDKMVKFVQECQAFRNAGKEVDITLGYHYTSVDYLPGICQFGLLTQKERKKRVIKVHDNGSTYGDGIYTSSNPFAFRDFRSHANVALLILRLRGTVYRLQHSSSTPRPNIEKLGRDVDTLTEQRGIGKDLMVLRTSSQCVVLGNFLSKDLDTSKMAEQILVAHGKISKLIKHQLQSHFRSVKTPPIPQSIDVCSSMAGPPHPPSLHQKRKERKTNKVEKRVKRQAVLRYGAPRNCLLAVNMRELCASVTPQTPTEDHECSICFEKLRGCKDLVSLKMCGHVYHKECLRDALKFDPRCPICRKVATEPQGKMPAGKMEIALDESLSCEGFDEGTWRLRYSIKAGVQKSYHTNPGVPFPSTSREAYLPNTEDGRRLLKRLAYAFSRGLTFTVGTSLTNGKENVTIWGSIHHKTKTRNGPYGYPDPGYFLNCNEELDALGVPPHDDPSLYIVFATRCLTSVNFGYLFATEEER